MKTLFNTLFFICFAVLPLTAAAQPVDEVARIFPDDLAVMLSYSRELMISLEKNIPVATSTENAEILIMNERANGMYNKYKVFHGIFDELKYLEAYTKVPDGSKFKKVKVADIKTQHSPSSGIFYDDVQESVFDFPSFGKGSIGVVSSKKFHKDPHLLSPYYFASYMPVLQSRFTVVFPAEFDLKYIIKNDNDKIVSVKEERKGRNKVLEFKARHVKMINSYGDAPSRAYYEPHVIIYIASYKDEHGATVHFLGSTDDLYKWNYSFIKEINSQPNTVLTHLADSLTAGIVSNKEKAKKIYQWVQKNIKYVAFEDGLEGFIPRQAADVCTRRYGDCKDMSSLLTALLQQAKVPAYFTWIGTRDIPYDYTEVPLPIVDNHMICAVQLDDGWVFLDGTDPNCAFGYPTSGIQGKQALIAINENKYEIVRVPVVESKKNVVIDSTFISIAGNGIKGSTSVFYNGYFGNDIYNSLMYRDQNDTRDFVKYKMGKASNKFILGDYTINRLNEYDKTIHIKAFFEVPDYGKEIGDEYYINLNLEKFYTTSVIDTANRKVSVENEFRYSITQYTILEIPQSYSVSYLPKDFSFTSHLIDLSIQYTKEANRIVARQEISSNTLGVQPSDFNKWNAAVKELLTQYKEQVVLQKNK